MTKENTAFLSFKGSTKNGGWLLEAQEYREHWKSSALACAFAFSLGWQVFWRGDPLAKPPNLSGLPDEVLALPTKARYTVTHAVSLRDLLLAEELSHIKNEVELIHPYNDDVVESILSQLSFDVTFPWEYAASNHRDWQGKEAVGFRVIGELKRSGDLGAFDRAMSHLNDDESFAEELLGLQPGASGSYEESQTLYWSGSEGPEPLMEPQEEEREILRKVAALEVIKNQIRGEE